MSANALHGTVWEHLEELRNTLLWVIGVILVVTMVSFTYYEQIISFLTLPLNAISTQQAQGSLTVTPYQLTRQRISNTTNRSIPYTLSPEDRLIDMQQTNPAGERQYLLAPGGHLDVETIARPNPLVVLGPIEGFGTALKSCFWFALVASSPIWLFFVFRFVAPGLYDAERNLAFPVIAFCLLFLVFGLLFAFYIAIPIANQALFAFNKTIAQNLWSLSLYLDYTVILLLANALAFELCAILLLLVHYGAVSAHWLITKRRHMCVAIFIVATLLTPPDVLTQLMLAIPLLTMYELIVLYAKWKRNAWLAPRGR